MTLDDAYEPRRFVSSHSFSSSVSISDSPQGTMIGGGSRLFACSVMLVICHPLKKTVPDAILAGH
jgi:hypothetical protein